MHTALEGSLNDPAFFESVIKVPITRSLMFVIVLTKSKISENESDESGTSTPYYLREWFKKICVVLLSMHYDQTFDKKMGKSEMIL